MSKKVLILAPHTDDGELGCGATIAKLIREGNEVSYAAFSICKESVPDGMPEDTLKNELGDSMNRFGIDKNKLHIFDFPVRKFPEHRQEILEEMVKLNRKINPDIVFMPSLHDIHQDHLTIAQEGIRAFKRSTVLGYEAPWNNLTFNNQSFCVVEQQDVDKKIECLSQYKSQYFRNYFQREYITGMAKAHGIQIGVELAEVFEVVRWIMR